MTELARPIVTDRSYLAIYGLDNPALVDACVTAVTGTPDGTGNGLLIVNPPIVVYGKPCTQHRSIGFFAVTDTDGQPMVEGYRYSGQLAAALPIPPPLNALLEYVNKTFQADFNGVLVNRYSNGTDRIGAHSDDESGLSGKKAVVAISWGQSRKFRIRHKHDGKIHTDIDTEAGTMLIMAGDFQKEFTHEIPVEKKKNGIRVSFTFRKHKPLGEPPAKRARMDH